MTEPCRSPGERAERSVNGVGLVMPAEVLKLPTTKANPFGVNWTVASPIFPLQVRHFPAFNRRVANSRERRRLVARSLSIIV
jgi:hypothetical protein